MFNKNNIDLKMGSTNNRQGGHPRHMSSPLLVEPKWVENQFFQTTTYYIFSESILVVDVGSNLHFNIFYRFGSDLVIEARTCEKIKCCKS
jgi:hypothetical protein